jgi:hypothetical protein
MGRKKKKRWDSKHTIVDTEEEDSLQERENTVVDICQQCEYSIPWQFKNWQNFFSSKRRFVEEFESWLSLKMQGYQFPNIETDKDKKTFHGNYQPRQLHLAEWEDDWHGWGGFQQYQTKWVKPEPKIKAPSGTVDSQLVCI